MSDKKVERSEEEWKQVLTPEQYAICRQKGTERAFTGEYHDCKDPGMYLCRCCGEPLFTSETKYDSGSGWPSFYQAVNPDAVETEVDNTLGMARTEVMCQSCGSHLGHVFEDGPQPTGQRFCINSASLKLEKED